MGRLTQEKIPFTIQAMSSAALAQISWSDPIVRKTIWSLLSLLILYGLTWAASRLLGRTVTDPLRRYKSRKLLYYAMTALGALVLMGIWSESVSQVALALTVLGAGIALALQQPILSVAGWLFILINRPYDVGDRIEIGSVSGDVIDIGVFKTTLLEIYPEGAGKGTQNTGRVIDFPNSLVLSQTLVSFTRGFEFLWDDYPILITFESNWQKAERLLLEIVRREVRAFEATARTQLEHMSKSYLVQYRSLEPAVFVVIRDSGVELGIRYLTPARQRRAIRDRISRAILTAFAQEPDIELAYPTYRIFRRDREEPRAKSD